MRKQPYIKASEIAQYHFCSISWYLQRMGCKPNSPRLEEGERYHVTLGENLTLMQIDLRRSTLFLGIGAALLLIGLLALLGWVS